MSQTRMIHLSRRSKRRGSVMAEFALGFMALLLLTVGLVDLGRGVWTHTTLAHAARQGARFAMTRGSLNPATATLVRDMVRSQAVGLEKNKVTVTTTWESGIERGGFVRVQVRYPYELVTGTLLLPVKEITLGADARVVVAN